MKRKARSSEYSKLQVICALFADRIGDDLYYARQIKESIEASLPDEQAGRPEAFLEAAQQLASTDPSDIGIIPAALQPSFSLLDLRVRLLDALKTTCLSPSPLLVLTGLKEAICPQGSRWTVRRKREYQDAIAYARSFCQSRSRPSSKLSLVIF